MKEPTAFELEVRYLPPNPNRTRGAHWTTIHKVRHEAGWHVAKAWTEAGRPRALGRPARVTYTLEVHGRADDADNRTARLKPVTDQLVALGALEDDSPEWCRLMIPNRISGLKGHPIIRIHIQYEKPVSSGDEHAA